MTDEELAQLIANGPAAGTAVLPPIGVPPGYQSLPTQPMGGVGPPGPPQPPQYFEGDDWRPAGLPPAQIAQFQKQLVEAGLIPPGSQYRLGAWDDTTRSAFKSALAYANSTGLNAQAALKVLAQSKPTAVPQPHLVPDIATVAQTVKQTVQQKLGRDATPEEVSHLSNVLLGLENKAIAAQDAAAAAQPGQAVQSVDPGAEFQQYIDSTYKPEVERTKSVTDLGNNRERLMSSIFSLDNQIKGSG